MRRHLASLLIAVVLLLFVAGLAKLFGLRFEQGDIYPRYSTLRADPYGTKGLFEGLGRISTLDVQRNYRPLEQLTLPDASTLMVVGLGWRRHDSHGPMEDMVLGPVRRGARCIIAFQDANSLVDVLVSHDYDDPNDPNSPPRTKRDRPRRARDRDANDRHLSWARALGFDIGRHRYRSGAEAFSDAIRVAPGDLPPSLPWLGRCYFRPLDPNWQVLYEVDGHPVLLERQLGRGSIVLLSDCYLLSNEAQVQDRQSKLITWLIGDSRHVLFDESQLGMYESPGIAALALKYRMHGLGWGLAFLAAVFIWSRFRETGGLGEDAKAREQVVQGKDMQSGMTALLRRSISTEGLVKTCYQEWTQSHTGRTRGQGLDASDAAAVRQLVDETMGRTRKDQQAVSLYRKVAQIINKKEDHDRKTGKV